MRLGLALLHLPPPSPPSVPKLCSAAAIAFTASLSKIRHQRQLTRIRSLSRRTRRAVAARVFAHLLGAERERRPPSCSFRCHLDAARSRLSMLRRLSRSQLQGSLRRAAKARRSRTSAVSDRRADGKLAISRRHPPLAAVFATRPPPASWAGSPRTRAAPRPEQTADGWPARVSRGWVRLGLGFPVEEVVSVRVRVSTRSVKLGLRAPRHGSTEGSKIV